MLAQELTTGSGWSALLQAIARIHALSASLMIDPGCTKKTVRDLSIAVALNDRPGDVRCKAAMSVPHLQADAASANTRKGNGGSVRTAVLCIDSSERPVIE
ncbi:hypothetical protein [Phaeobacter sp. SYSU ZJ3003]|uniref:hypothetical protein n=1 Tax=Phaeobacter sp. SYSU ZJ3003 TaxID=2109330 RepID=UPI00351C622B